MGDLGWKGESSKVRGGKQEISSSKIPQVNLYLWEKSKWKNTNKEDVGSYDRYKGRVCAKKGEGAPIVKRRERRDV